MRLSRWSLASFAAFGLFVVACGAGSVPETTLLPLEVSVVGTTETYSNAPMVDRAMAQSLNPAPDSPEAAVVKFLASRLRGDGAWKDALASPMSERGRRSIEEWEDWEVKRFQLRSRSETSQDAVWVTVYFEVSVSCLLYTSPSPRDS